MALENINTEIEKNTIRMSIKSRPYVIFVGEDVSFINGSRSKKVAYKIEYSRTRQ